MARGRRFSAWVVVQTLEADEISGRFVMANNVAGLAKLPQLVSEAAQEAFGEHLGAVVVHGSGHRGKDFIPHWSDFDCHLYIDSSVLAVGQEERIDRALRFRRGLASIDLVEFAIYYIQVFLLLAERYPREWPVPVEGTFEIAYGTRPAGWDGPDHPDLLTAAAATLGGLSSTLDGIPAEVVDLCGKDFARWVRRLGTYIKPALYAAATLVSGDPQAIRRADLESVLAVLREHVELSSAQSFYERARRWLDVRSAETELEAMTREGVDALRALALWHGARQ